MHDPHDSSHPTWKRLVRASKGTPVAEPSETLPKDFADKLLFRLHVQNASPLERLVAESRTAPAPPSANAPFGFATRIVSRWQQVRQLRGYVLWRRWSAIAALIAILLYLILYFVMKMNPPEPAPNPGLPLPPEP